MYYNLKCDTSDANTYNTLEFNFAYQRALILQNSVKSRPLTKVFWNIIGTILFIVGSLAFLYIAFFLLAKLLSIAIETDTNKHIKYGAYAFVATIITTILFSGIRKSINLKKGIQAFYNSRQTWRFLWLIGGLFSFLAYIVEHHLLFINWYFIAVGTIPLFNSLYKYAEADHTGLTLHYGIFFNRKKLKLNWSNIADVEICIMKKYGTISAGSKIWVSKREEYEGEVLRIQLKDPLPKDLCEHLNNSNRINIFVNEYHINEKRNVIVLNTPPQIGFDHFAYAVKKILHPNQQIEEPYSRFLYLFFETIWFITMFIVSYMQFFAHLVLLPT